MITNNIMLVVTVQLQYNNCHNLNLNSLKWYSNIKKQYQ